MDLVAHTILRQASLAKPHKEFVCRIFSPEWNEFVEFWAPKIHAFVEEAFAGFYTEPLPEILELSEAFHAAGANASFNMASGQIHLGTHIENLPGVTLEKLTHEMIHGALAGFPDDVFYDEGTVDYSTWIVAHAPYWGVHREAMIKAAADNIRNRRDRALTTGSDYDRKRWAGGVWAMTNYGPNVVAAMRQKKLENNRTW